MSALRDTVYWQYMCNQGFHMMAFQSASRSVHSRADDGIAGGRDGRVAVLGPLACMLRGFQCLTIYTPNPPSSHRAHQQSSIDNAAQIKGTSAEDAKQEYIALIERDDPNWEQHEAFKDYTE